MLNAFVNEMPVRALAMMSRGRIKQSLVERLIHATNNNWWRALIGDPVRSE